MKQQITITYNYVNIRWRSHPKAKETLTNLDKETIIEDKLTVCDAKYCYTVTTAEPIGIKIGQRIGQIEFVYDYSILSEVHTLYTFTLSKIRQYIDEKTGEKRYLYIFEQ